MCERVITPACQAPATTTVPMFMGAIKVCERCRLELTAGPVSETEPVMVVGDYVRVNTLNCMGIIKRVLGNAEYVVEWAYLVAVDGAERLVEGLGVIALENLSLT